MKFFPSIFIALTLTACTSGPPIDTRYTSQNQDSRVQFLILHFTSGDFQHSLEELTVGDVSSHYLVDVSPPTIYQLVPENKRAWHAGVSYWNGYAQLNAASIGIEIVNRGERDTSEGRVWAEYPQEQIDAVIALVKKIVAEHRIKPEYILGHSDIAPQRKIDPGPRFPWKQLADAGLIPWPDVALVAQKRTAFEASLPEVDWFQQRLARFGFAVPLNGQLDEATRNVLSAFQMKYRPARFDGVPDAETAAILEALVDLLPAGGTPSETIPVPRPLP
ncbi:MAG TPA: N-acetylmuramoyl-L-alanine amidase [Usitatibacteraceae bacterium]